MVKVGEVFGRLPREAEIPRFSVYRNSDGWFLGWVWVKSQLAHLWNDYIDRIFSTASAGKAPRDIEVVNSELECPRAFGAEGRWAREAGGEIDMEIYLAGRLIFTSWENKLIYAGLAMTRPPRSRALPNTAITNFAPCCSISVHPKVHRLVTHFLCRGRGWKWMRLCGARRFSVDLNFHHSRLTENWSTPLAGSDPVR